MIINDWAMKLLRMRFRETPSQWFAKRGIRWQFSAVVLKSTHPDCPVVSASEHTFHTYSVTIDSCKQDWFSVSCILEEVRVCVKGLGIGRKRYRVLHKRDARQRENTMSLSLSILLAALESACIATFKTI